MKILLDECVPKKVKRFLVGHEIFTAQEVGLANTKNGKLLAAAEAAQFDVLVTCDKGMPYQQRITGRALAIVQLPTNTLDLLKPIAGRILDTINSAARGHFYEVNF